MVFVLMPLLQPVITVQDVRTSLRVDTKACGSAVRVAPDTIKATS